MGIREHKYTMYIVKLLVQRSLLVHVYMWPALQLLAVRDSMFFAMSSRPTEGDLSAVVRAVHVGGGSVLVSHCSNI